jgi:hypothetical protein
MGVTLVNSQGVPLYAAPLGFSANYTFTRPNDTTAYTINDVIGDVARGATLIFNFAPIVPASGAEVVIDAVRFEHDTTALVSTEASHAIAFYNRPPPSALADNAAYDVTANDRASYQGVLTVGTPVDIGSTLYVEISNQNKRVSLLTPNLYAYLTTAAGYTPVALDVYRLWIYGRLI